MQEIALAHFFFLIDQGFIFIKDPLSPKYMQLPRETLECDPIIVEYSESKWRELQRYLFHCAFLAKINEVMFYFSKQSHDFGTVGHGSTAWLDHSDVLVNHNLL